MKEKYSITIGRQLGSGGKDIGEKLAKQLGFSFFDKELIQIASKESGLSKEFFEQADESSRFSLLGGLLGLRANYEGDLYTDNYLGNESLFKIQSDIIRELAEKKSCIFVGRCADYILREYENCLNIFITADLKDRIQRVAQRLQLSKEKAKLLIEQTDKKRAGYYNYYSNKTWGLAASYHLCINSSQMGIDETATYILHFSEKFFRSKKIEP